MIGLHTSSNIFIFINVITSNKADRKEKSNQLEVPLKISNGRVLLERSKSKSDGNIGEESKFESKVQFPCMKCISVTGSIDCKAHQEDVVSRRKKKLTEKCEDFT